MTPKQEMELLLEEAKRQTNKQEMKLLLEEAERQTMGDICPSCGQGKEHAGWMLCLDARLIQRKEGMKDGKSQNGKNKAAESQVSGTLHHESGWSELRPTGSDARGTTNRTPPRKVRQEGSQASASVTSGGRKARKSKSRQGLHRNPVSLFLSIVSGTLKSIGLGISGAFQLLVGGVLKTGRGILGLLGLLLQGVVEVGRGILKLLSLLVRGVVAAVKGILGLLSLLVRGVVSAGRGVLRLSQLLVNAVVQTGKWVLAMFKLLARAVTTAGRKVAAVLVWMVKPVGWALGMLVRGSIMVGKRVQELLQLSVQAARRLIPTRQIAPEAIGLITSEGGPQITNQVSAEATILITSGLDQGRSFQVGGEPVTIGSGENCGIRLPAAPGFAAEHARLWWRDGQRMLHHLAPDEATVVAGKQIIWTSLQNGDEASIGPYSLRITTAPASVSS